MVDVDRRRILAAAVRGAVSAIVLLAGLLAVADARAGALDFEQSWSSSTIVRSAPSLALTGGDTPAMRFDAALPTSRGQASDMDDLRAGFPSRGKTILMSAVMPGWGQLSWNRRGSAAVFMATDVAAWTSLAVFRVQGNLRKDRYIEFAESFAGVVNGRDEADSYYQSLARYDRSDPGPGSYNEIEVRLVAKRELFPDDPAAQDAYIAENSITGDLGWNWQSEDRRFEYADIRSSSESSFHRSEFAVAAVIANRIVSVMHAVWMTADKSKDDAATDATQTTSSGAVSLATAFQPFVKPDLFGGEHRIGFRRSF